MEASLLEQTASELGRSVLLDARCPFIININEIVMHTVTKRGGGLLRGIGFLTGMKNSIQRLWLISKITNVSRKQPAAFVV